jgi:hypothetical protein
MTGNSTMQSAQDCTNPCMRRSYPTGRPAPVHLAAHPTIAQERRSRRWLTIEVMLPPRPAAPRPSLDGKP